MLSRIPVGSNGVISVACRILFHQQQSEVPLVLQSIVLELRAFWLCAFTIAYDRWAGLSRPKPPYLAYSEENTPEEYSKSSSRFKRVAQLRCRPVGMFQVYPSVLMPVE